MFYKGFLAQRFSVRTGAVIGIAFAAVAYYLATHKLTAEMATMLGSALGAGSAVVAVIIATNYGEYRQQSQIRDYIAASVVSVADRLFMLRHALVGYDREFRAYGIQGNGLPAEVWISALKNCQELRVAIDLARKRLARILDHAYKLEWNTVETLHRVEELLPELSKLTDEIQGVGQSARLYGAALPDDMSTTITRQYAEFKQLLNQLGSFQLVRVGNQD
ncbi:MAG TPA: hypothetical protein VIT90_06665 [Lysobacter sp.]